ncbi:hypothetical protein OH76DRAFT_160131 [Lentinus brumalis]|uniref:Uncharacterized protein n=1 Tax=Lentinus brumalis TaxID=2498619 RepID=A0A371DIW5_9APHY|nr:hypothetical protein OH76DRAFT_160131 [Polyporus brumalis]
MIPSAINTWTCALGPRLSGWNLAIMDPRILRTCSGRWISCCRGLCTYLFRWQCHSELDIPDRPRLVLYVSSAHTELEPLTFRLPPGIGHECTSQLPSERAVVCKLRSSGSNERAPSPSKALSRRLESTVKTETG